MQADAERIAREIKECDIVADISPLKKGLLYD